MNFVNFLDYALVLLLVEVQTQSHCQYYPGGGGGHSHVPNHEPYVYHSFYEHRVGVPAGHLQPLYTQHQYSNRRDVRYYGTHASNIPTEVNRQFAVATTNSEITSHRNKRKCPEASNNGQMSQASPEWFNEQDVDASVEDSQQFEKFRVGRRMPNYFPHGFPRRHNGVLPQCSESASRTPQRIYRKDGKCYPTLSQAPCNALMKFYPENNPIYGDCDCDIDNGIVSRPLAYWEPHDRCYLLFHRGPCRLGDWLILDECGFPECARRHRNCSTDDNETSSRFAFLHNGKCYITGNYYPELCSSSNKKVYFPGGSSEPKCLDAEPRPESRGLGGSGELRCKPGYKKMQNGECKRKATYAHDY